MTRSLAVELSGLNRRIRVNAVLPGPVLLAADASDEKRREAIESTLLKRLGTPEQVADNPDSFTGHYLKRILKPAQRIKSTA